MCGIAGEIVPLGMLGINIPLNCKSMVESLTHRGPDDQSFYKTTSGDKRVGLGMCRLSIIDREHGKQPFGDTCKVFFNGEIYNHQNLRRAMRHAEQYTCQTQCDSEVVAKEYELSAEDFPCRLWGMYAIAVWDERKEQLKLYRDRVGKKPLYYYYRPGVFLFASEIKAILQHPAYEKQLDERAIWQYLCMQYVPEPDTAFEGIKAVRPGGSVVYDPASDMLTVTEDRAIELPDVRAEESEADTIEAVLGETYQAVNSRLESEVPLGVYLSGGIDSAIITAIASESVQDLHTFTMGFLEDEFDETKGAQLIADRYGTNHHVERVSEVDLIPMAHEIVAQYDQPFGDCSAIPTMLLARLSKKYITVALSGDGGDEAFGGYVRHWQARPQDYWQFMSVWPPNRRAQIWPRGMGKFNDDMPNNYVNQFIAQAGQDRVRTGLMFSDIRTYLLNDIIVKMERATMAASVEARCPFLDPAVLDLGLSLPDAMKLGANEGKLILRKAFANQLPPSTLTAPKRGFGVPMDKWLSEKTGVQLMAETILARDAFGPLDFDRNVVAQLVVSHMNGDIQIGHALWLLIMLDLWLRRNF